MPCQPGTGRLAGFGRVRLAVPEVEDRGEQRAAAPGPRWPAATTASGACSCASSSASWAASPGQRLGAALPPDPHPDAASVLMNGPRTRSAPAPAFIRPNSTVPNTTSLPVPPATPAPAPTPGGTPWPGTPRQPPRQLAYPPGQVLIHREYRSAPCPVRPRTRPAARTEPSSRVTSPSSPAKYRSCSSPRPPAGPGPRTPGTASAAAAGRPART